MTRRLPFTEGQLYTMVFTLAIAIALGVTGIPQVLRARDSNIASALNPLRPIQPIEDTVTAPGVAPVPAVSAEPDAAPADDRNRTQPPPTFVRPAPSPAPATAASAPAATTTAEPTVSAPPARPAPGSISVFARVGDPGAPGGLAIGADGTVYVTTDNGTAHGGTGPSRVFAFDAAGTQTGARTVTGQPDGHARGLTGVAVDPRTGHLAVLDLSGGRVLSVNMTTGAQRELATIPDLPACLVSLGASRCQQGAEDRKPSAISAAYDERGDLFFTDPAQDTIWRLRAGQQVPEVWFQSTFFSSGAGPDGLALGSSAVDFTVGMTVDPANLGGGGLYRVAVNADGSAGALILVAEFQSGEQPGPLAMGSSGTAYVVLRQSGAIVSVAPDGARTGQISPPGGGPVPLDAPSALALVPDRLLVANKGSGRDPARWAVLAVALNDGPRP